MNNTKKSWKDDPEAVADMERTRAELASDMHGAETAVPTVTVEPNATQGETISAEAKEFGRRFMEKLHGTVHGTVEATRIAAQATAAKDAGATLAISELLTASGAPNIGEARTWLASTAATIEAQAKKIAGYEDAERMRLVAHAVVEGRIDDVQANALGNLSVPVAELSAMLQAFQPRKPADVTAVIDGAVMAGKVMPSRKAVWLDAAATLGADRAAKLLEDLPVIGLSEDDTRLIGPDTSAPAVSAELASALERSGLSVKDYHEARRYEQRQREEAGR